MEASADAASALESDQRLLSTLRRQHEEETRRAFLLWLQAVNLALGSALLLAALLLQLHDGLAARLSGAAARAWPSAAPAAPAPA